MIDLIEMILMGVVATLFMDLSSILMARMKVIHPPIGPEAVGRWALYLFRGVFRHKDINATTPLKNEKSAALLSHYLIGIALAGIYLFLEAEVPAFRLPVLMPLAFGLATVILPWFWLYPSIGLGVVASRVSERSPYVVTSLVNHTNFGIGLLLWIVLFRSLLV